MRLKLLVYAALTYQCMRPSATSVPLSTTTYVFCVPVMRLRSEGRSGLWSMLIGVQLPKTEPAREVWQRMVRLSRFCVSICTFVLVICVNICTFVLGGVAENGAAVALLRQYLYFVPV